VGSEMCIRDRELEPVLVQISIFSSNKIQFKQYFILKSWHDSQNLKSIFQPPRIQLV
jgi:hypothetical protein